VAGFLGFANIVAARLQDGWAVTGWGRFRVGAVRGGCGSDGEAATAAGTAAPIPTAARSRPRPIPTETAAGARLMLRPEAFALSVDGRSAAG